MISKTTFGNYFFIYGETYVWQNYERQRILIATREKLYMCCR